MGCIYLATCLVNGKQYVGKTARTLEVRIAEHQCGTGYRGREPMITCAIRKHGKENFKWEILFSHDDESILYKKEVEYMALYNTLAPKGYNATTGGRKSFQLSGEALAKNQARADVLGKPVYCLETMKTYKTIAEASRITGEHTSTISACCRNPERKTMGRHFCLANEVDIKDLHYRSENGLLRLTKTRVIPPRSGYKMSSEFCAQRSEIMREHNAFKGKKHTKESLELMGKNRKGKCAGAMSGVARRVTNTDTGETFDTLRLAVEYFGLPSTATSNISSCCSGKLKSAYGYHWQYADEEIERKGVTL